MYKNKKIVAIIPARKGSKGIPNKNIVNLNGKPLIEYTLEAVCKVDIVDKIIVSTDSDEILNIAKKYKIEVKNLRPIEISQDESTIYDVLKYEINNYNLIQEEYEVLVLLQPTSPLRQSYMIDDALRKFIDENQESAVSVSEVVEHPVFIRSINKYNELVGILNLESTIRRQELPQYYKVNGMIYINKLRDIENRYISFNDNKSPIIIPKEYDIDIDTIEELEKVELILKKNKLKNK